MNPGQIVLIAFGFLSAVTGAFFIYKKAGEGASDIEVPFFGKIKTTSNGVILFIIGAVCIYKGVEMSGKVTPEKESHAFIFSRVITDESANPARNAFAYLVLNKETLLSDPPFTGDDGRFKIMVDTAEGLLIPFYCGKEGYDTISVTSNINSVGGMESLKLQKKILPVADSTFSIGGPGVDHALIREIDETTGYHSLPVGKNKIMISYDESPLEQDNDEPHNWRYNSGGKVFVNVNGKRCLSINDEIPATVSIFQSKENVIKQVTKAAVNIVNRNKKSISLKLKTCLE